MKSPPAPPATSGSIHAYRAMWLRIEFIVDGVEAEIANFSDPSGWLLDDDEPRNRALVSKIRQEIVDAQGPIVDHFVSAGFVRADGTEGMLLNGVADEEDRGITLYLIYRCDDEVLVNPEPLARLNETRVPLQSVPGAELAISTYSEQVNPDTLYQVLSNRLVGGHVGIWGGAGTPDMMPRDYEMVTDWQERVSLPANKVVRLLERWKRCGGKFHLFSMVGSAEERATGNQPIRWLVPGLIPCGCLTLIAGGAGAGKSTLLSWLAAVIDSESEVPGKFLGAGVNERGVVVFVSGEDAENVLDERASYYEDENGEARGFVIDGRNKSLDDILELAFEIPNIVLLIIEPIASFVIGDENDNTKMSAVYRQLDRLSVEKGCAIVAAHHLGKGRTPRSMDELKLRIRGAQVHVDRPRMLIGMINMGNGVVRIGIIKGGFPPSQALWAPEGVGRDFRRDESTLTLLPVDDFRTPTPLVTNDAEARIEAVFALPTVAKEVIRRTGKSGLHEMRLPQLAGLSRNVIRNCVTALIASGKVIDGPDGLKIPPKPM